ncbi:MAG: winged helix-turn-helix transcriptional regulator, partial [Anaerolineae bacterium]|nr:winged helix-turn-helix transcriptional regulator [Anaerolineae bacterium]
MSTRSYQQLCGLAYALDVIGERWTLLIIRELIPGPGRFTDLLEGLPGISTNLLSTRLKQLEERGVLRRRELPPPAGVMVYELTALGRSLEASLLELGRWGAQFVPAEPGEDRLLHLGSYALTPKTFFRAELAAGVDDTYELEIDGERQQVRVKDGELTVRQGAAAEADVVLRTDVETYLGLLRGQIGPEEAAEEGLIEVEGDPGALRRF